MREFYEWCADTYDQTFTLLDDDETWRPDLPDSVYPINKHYWYTTCGRMITGNFTAYPQATIAVFRGKESSNCKLPPVLIRGSGVIQTQTDEGILLANEDGHPDFSSKAFFRL